MLNAPYQNLTKRTRALAVDKLLGLVELDVHVRVNADQGALVFGLPPLETDNDLLVDPSCMSVPG